jgi:hypothetical protein
MIATVPEDDVALFDAEARRLVADLHAPRPRVFWMDLIASAGLGWAGFALAVMLPPFSVGMIAAAVVAIFAFYRGLCFIHEITHVRSGALPGFELMWNVLIGLPLLMPSSVYLGVHQDHHKLSTYSTVDDPEYLPFARSGKLTVRFTRGACDSRPFGRAFRHRRAVRARLAAVPSLPGVLRVVAIHESEVQARRIGRDVEENARTPCGGVWPVGGRLPVCVDRVPSLARLLDLVRDHGCGERHQHVTHVGSTPVRRHR